MTKPCIDASGYSDSLSLEDGEGSGKSAAWKELENRSYGQAIAMAAICLRYSTDGSAAPSPLIVYTID